MTKKLRPKSGQINTTVYLELDVSINYDVEEDDSGNWTPTDITIEKIDQANYHHLPAWLEDTIHDQCYELLETECYDDMAASIEERKISRLDVDY